MMEIWDVLSAVLLLQRYNKQKQRSSNTAAAAYNSKTEEDMDLIKSELFIIYLSISIQRQRQKESHWGLSRTLDSTVSRCLWMCRAPLGQPAKLNKTSPGRMLWQPFRWETARSHRSSNKSLWNPCRFLFISFCFFSFVSSSYPCCC